VTPVLEEHARQVSGYFPHGQWYDWYTHRIAANVTSREGIWMQLSAPLDHIPGAFYYFLDTISLTFSSCSWWPYCTDASARCDNYGIS
jgi:hypothetical protein